MYALSRLPKDPKPVVLIENIANIPVGSPDVYDDPVYVENVLLHSWKNEVINLTHWREGAFQIVSRDYTIIIIVSSGDLQKTHYSVAGEIGIVTIPG